MDKSEEGSQLPQGGLRANRVGMALVFVALALAVGRTTEWYAGLPFFVLAMYSLSAPASDFVSAKRTSRRRPG